MSSAEKFTQECLVSFYKDAEILFYNIYYSNQNILVCFEQPTVNSNTGKRGVFDNPTNVALISSGAGLSVLLVGGVAAYVIWKHETSQPVSK